MDEGTFDAFENALLDRIDKLEKLFSAETPWGTVSLTTKDSIRQDLLYAKNALDYLHNNYTRGE